MVDSQSLYALVDRDGLIISHPLTNHLEIYRNESDAQVARTERHRIEQVEVCQKGTVAALVAVIVRLKQREQLSQEPQS